MGTERPATDTDMSADGDAPAGIDFSRVLCDELERTGYGSYTNLNPNTFHASSVGYTKRQIYVKKLGLDAMDAEGLGATRVGSLIHEFIEEALQEHHATADLRIEQDVSLSVRDIVIEGRYDAYDPQEDVVYEFKTRSGFYRFDPPSPHHRDQLLSYMHAADAQYGQLVYVSKKDLEVRTWPEDGLIERSEYQAEWDGIVERLHRVREAILTEGVALSAEEIPFEKGDDWLSQQEQLVGWL